MPNSLSLPHDPTKNLFSFAAPIDRLREMFPTWVSRSIALQNRWSPNEFTFQKIGDNDEVLLAVGWVVNSENKSSSDITQNNKVKLVIAFARYGINGLHPFKNHVKPKRSVSGLNMTFDEETICQFVENFLAPAGKIYGELQVLDPDTGELKLYEEPRSKEEKTKLSLSSHASEDDSSQDFSLNKEKEESKDVGSSDSPTVVLGPRDRDRIKNHFKANLQDALNKLKKKFDDPNMSDPNWWKSKSESAGNSAMRKAERITLWPPSTNEHRKRYRNFRNNLISKTGSIWLPEADTNINESDSPLRIIEMSLSFYQKKGSLFEIKVSSSAGNKTAIILASLDDKKIQPVTLKGWSQSIHDFNQSMSEARQLKISQQTARDYLLFFCRNISGKSGVFNIVEKVDDLDWRYGTEEIKKIVKGHIFPITLIQETDVNLTYVAFVQYSRDLYLTLIDVRQDGIVDMHDDWSLVKNLPIYPFFFDSKYRFSLAWDKCERETI